jgi:predicted MFS family arabinose efflux permease
MEFDILMKRWLLSPDFTKLWVGQTVSEFGSHITGSGIPLIAVITLAATPTQMGTLTAVASIPVLLFGLFAGVWIDRLRRRPILIAMDLARFALVLTLPVAALTGHLSIELLYVLLAVTSILALIFRNAYHAYLPSLVERERLVEANSRLSTSDALAEIGGPAVAGVLIQIISAPFAVIFDAITFLFSGACIALIRKPEPAPPPPSEGRSVLREMAEGIRTIAANPILRVLAITAAVDTFFGNFFGVLYGIYGIRDLGMTPALLGVTIACGGIGALVGALIASRLQRRFGLGRVLVGSLLIAGLNNLLIPLAGGSLAQATLLLMFSQVVGDTAMMVYVINSLSLQQIVVPNHLLGRTNASVGFLTQGIAPVGAVVSGALATSLGARSTLLIAVVGMLVAALWFARSPVRHLEGYELPAEALADEAAEAVA